MTCLMSHMKKGWIWLWPVFLVLAATCCPVFGADVNTLIRSLSDPNPNTRYQAVKNLGHMGRSAAPAVPALVKALEDDDRRIMKEAMLALRSIGGPAVPALIKALSHAQHDVREQAALALGKMGPPANQAIPALVKILDDTNRRVVDAAEYALRSIGHPALPALKRRAAQGGPGAEIAGKLIKKIDPGAK